MMRFIRSAKGRITFPRHVVLALVLSRSGKRWLLFLPHFCLAHPRWSLQGIIWNRSSDETPGHNIVMDGRASAETLVNNKIMSWHHSYELAHRNRQRALVRSWDCKKKSIKDCPYPVRQWDGGGQIFSSDTPKRCWLLVRWERCKRWQTRTNRFQPSSLSVGEAFFSTTLPTRARAACCPVRTPHFTHRNECTAVARSIPVMG